MSNITYDFNERFIFDCPNLIYISKAKYESDWNSTPHFHDFTEIIFFLEGEGTVTYSDYSPSVRKGHLLLVAPNTLHTENSSKDKPLTYIILGIDNVAFDFMPKDDDGKQIPLFDFSDCYDKTKSQLLQILDEAEKKREDYWVMLANLLSGFLVFIKRKTKLYTKPLEKVYASKECAFVKQYIDTHYSFDITLTDLASKAYLCKNYLLRSFKKYFNVTPIEYLQQVRLKEAKILLERTHMPISSISQAVGFSGASRFAEKLLETTGFTPTQYRKQFLLKKQSENENDLKDPPPPPPPSVKNY